MYKLLGSPEVRDAHGEFDRADLAHLLDLRVYPLSRHEFILHMMQEPDVGLALRLAVPDRERYLIPEALPAAEPDYGMWPGDSLRFRFKYQYLPSGLMPRFIVQAHRLLTEKPTRWRTGVVLAAADCPVLVRADLKHERIDISVAGPPHLRRSALNVVLVDLEEVHRRNPECKPEARVPLPDQTDNDVGYEYLLELERDEGPDHEYRPEKARRKYRVGELLEGVRVDPPDRRRDAGDTERDPRLRGVGSLTLGDHSTLHLHMEANDMAGDFHSGQGHIVKFGPNAKVQGNAFQQTWNQMAGATDLKALAEELAKVRKELKRQDSDDPDHDAAVGQVAAAEKAAKEGDGAGVLGFLKSAGSWALKAATDAGAKLAEEAIKKAMSL
jgi:hypothetical protein